MLSKNKKKVNKLHEKKQPFNSKYKNIKKNIKILIFQLKFSDHTIQTQIITWVSNIKIKEILLILKQL